MTTPSRHNLEAASHGGRTYCGTVPPTDAQREADALQAELASLERRLKLADQAAQRTFYSPEPHEVLQAEYADATIEQMAKRRGLAYQTMYARMKAVGCTFRPQNTRLPKR